MKILRDPIIRLAGLTGLITPPIFAAILILLSIAEYDFMRSLGWDPIRAPSFDWPSGLSLGPYGNWMTGTFLAGGGATHFFAYGLRRALRDGPGTELLSLAGLGLAGLAFTTDPTRRAGPATWHGHLHDLSFVVLGLALIAAMLLLGRAFRQRPGWRDLALVSWVGAGLCLPALLLRGAAVYGFLLTVLIWYEILAWRLTTASGGLRNRSGSPPARLARA